MQEADQVPSFLNAQEIQSLGSKAEPIAVTLIQPSSIRALLVIPSETPDKDLSSRYAPLIHKGIAIALVKMEHNNPGSALNAREKLESGIFNLIAATRDLQARGLASPKNLFLYGDGEQSLTATWAAMTRPELFRGVILSSPILDLETAVLGNGSSAQNPYAVKFGKDREILRLLSPTSESPEFFPLDTYIRLPPQSKKDFSTGTMEWIRRTACSHPELRSLAVSTDVGQKAITDDPRDTSPHPDELFDTALFILSTMRRPL